MVIGFSRAVSAMAVSFLIWSAPAVSAALHVSADVTSANSARPGDAPDAPVIMAQADAGLFSREIWREAQEALNHFGYDAGKPDGLPGRKTRAAIRRYQADNGQAATGSFSRATMGLLLEAYRNRSDEKAGEAAQGSGLPPAVVAELNDTADMCDMPVAALKSKPGFLQTYDLNGDGRDDYIVDGAYSDCMFTCGAANCTVTVYASTPSGGFVANEFLAGGTDGDTFVCAADGACRFATPADKTQKSSASTQVPASSGGEADANASVGQAAPVSDGGPAATGIYASYLEMDLPRSKTGNLMFFNFPGLDEASVFVQNRMVNRPIYDFTYYVYRRRGDGSFEPVESNEDRPVFLDSEATRQFDGRVRDLPPGSLFCWQFDPREEDNDYRVFDLVEMVDADTSMMIAKSFVGPNGIGKRHPAAPKLTTSTSPCKTVMAGGTPEGGPDIEENWGVIGVEKSEKPMVRIVDQLRYFSTAMPGFGKAGMMGTLHNNTSEAAVNVLVALHDDGAAGMDAFAMWQPMFGFMDGLDGDVAFLGGKVKPERVTACVEYQTLDETRRFFRITPLAREKAPPGQAGWAYHQAAPTIEFEEDAGPGPGCVDRLFVYSRG